MTKAQKETEHLIRYFLIFAIIVFTGYAKHLHETVFLALIGPCLYVAETLQSFFIKNIYSLPETQTVNFYGFLLPVTLFYYCFIGYQMKRLWNERGPIRILIFLIFMGFLGYLHLQAFKTLMIYFKG